MFQLDSHPSGRHFLQIPVRRWCPSAWCGRCPSPSSTTGARPSPPSCGRCLDGLRTVFQTRGPVLLISRPRAPAPGKPPSSTRCRRATACWCSRPAISRRLWRPWRERLGLDVDRLGRSRYGDGIPAARPGAPARPTAPGRSARCSSCTTRRPPASPAMSPRSGAAIDGARHPALLLVDTVSSLGSIDYRHDEWGVDVTLAGSQKGLMLPPGLAFNAASERAVAASEKRALPALLLGLGADARAQQAGRLPVHAGDRTPLRPARGPRHARARKGCPRCSRRHARLAEATRARRAGAAGSSSCAGTPPSARTRSPP